MFKKIAAPFAPFIAWRERLPSRFKYWLNIIPYNLLVWFLLFLYLLPVFFMMVTAMMSTDQLMDSKAPLYPAQPVRYTYDGQDYPLYIVPTENGDQRWALVNPGTTSSDFINPLSPEAGLITWQGSWRQLNAVYEFHPSWENFLTLFKALPFPQMLRNTFFLTLVGEIGVLLSSIVVAYGFARFPLPGGNLLFYVLIATILIPEKVTFIPTFYVYVVLLHWKGTVYPVLLHLFFGNAVYIFLLRQNFKSIPLEQEEAAMLDGAGPLRRLFQVILPQSWPVVITVSLLHFFFTWNETRLASLYLGTNPALMPVSFGVQNYQSRVPIQNMIEASTLVVLALPVIILFISQRFFMQGLVVTGTER